MVAGIRGNEGPHRPAREQGEAVGVGEGDVARVGPDARASRREAFAVAQVSAILYFHGKLTINGKSSPYYPIAFFVFKFILPGSVLEI